MCWLLYHQLRDFLVVKLNVWCPLCFSLKVLLYEPSVVSTQLTKSFHAKDVIKSIYSKHQLSLPWYYGLSYIFRCSYLKHIGSLSICPAHLPVEICSLWQPFTVAVFYHVHLLCVHLLVSIFYTVSKLTLLPLCAVYCKAISYRMKNLKRQVNCMPLMVNQVSSFIQKWLIGHYRQVHSCGRTKCLSLINRPHVTNHNKMT